MKNILLSTVATLGLSAITTYAQAPKTVFQYEQALINVLQTAVQKGTADNNALPMVEGDSCYVFEAKIKGIDRQVFYCADKKKGFVARGEKTKDVDEQERQQLLDTITKKYPH